MTMESYQKSVFQQNSWQGYQYLLPSLAVFAIFTLFPIVYTMLLSFTNYSSANLYFYSQVWDQYFSQEEYTLSPKRYHYEIYSKSSKKAIYDLVLIEELENSNNSTYEKLFLYRDLDLNQSSFPLFNYLSSDQFSYPPEGSKLTLRDIINLRSQLKKLV
jgi:maltose/maltodextrin transport system permease protein